MFENVLVGIDGHLGGEDAVALARQLTAPDGQLTLAHGSTSNQLARAARCPLLVLTRGAHPAARAGARPVGIGADASEAG